jgi:hypothetical protein
MPKTPPPTEVLDAKVAKWLYRVSDRVDQARGVQFIGEPSAAFQIYREYELLYKLLLNAKGGDNTTLDNQDSWRLHPRLAQFRHVDDALRSIEEDWIRFGYRREVSEAIAEFEKAAGSRAWIEWTRAKTRLETELTLVGRNTEVYRTVLSPPPAEWLRMGSWIKLTAHSAGNREIRFQIARVQIVRPWFQVEQLLDGRIKVSDPRVVGELFKGGKPTLTDYPGGRLSVYPTELLIVRQIRVSPGAEDALHPLTLFAKTDELQLLGYIVRYIERVSQ